MGVWFKVVSVSYGTVGSLKMCGNILSYGTCLNCDSGTGNSFTYDPILESFDEVLISPNPPPQYHFNIYLCVNPLIDHHCCYECGNSLNDFFCYQCTCEFCGNGAHKLPVCCDDDDDYDSTITPNEPVDSLSIGDEHLDTIPSTESDEFIKSCVENLVPNPSESEGENGCDVLACFTIFSNVLFEADYESDSSDYQSCSDEDFPEEIFSNPLFEEEIISIKIDQHHFNAESDLIESMPNHDSSIISSSSKIDSLLDEFAGELTLLKSISPGIDETDCYPKDEIRFTERLLYDNSSPRPPEEFVSKNSDADIESFSPSPIPNEDSDSFMEEIDLSFNLDDPMPPSIEDDDDDSERDVLILEELPSNYSLSLHVPIPNLTITRVSNQEKSPDLLSHRSLENFQLSAKRSMMIHGKSIPILDVPLFHFYPLDQTIVLGGGGNWVKLSDLKQALRGRHPMLISSLVILVVNVCLLYAIVVETRFSCLVCFVVI
nr:hypothetical protein [Tanacetum cinerariifolium]